MALLLCYGGVMALAPGRTVGIDLGTTNSAIAVIRDGVPEVVKNRHGQLTTPSAVAFLEGGDVLVGEDALVQSSRNVFNTVVAAKGFIGRPFKSMSLDARAAGCEWQPIMFGVRRAIAFGGQRSAANHVAQPSAGR